MKRTGVYDRHGVLVRVAYLAFAVLFWAATGFGWLFRKRTVVLCYHGVTPAQAGRLRRQFSLVASRCVRLPGDSPRARASAPSVCVTFDDGFRCLEESAIPIARELGIPIWVFPVAGNLGCAPRWSIPAGHAESAMALMSAGDVEGCAKDGIVRIGSHTATHADLARLAPDALDAELRESRRALERLVGYPVDVLAVPYGSYDGTVLDRARRAGYRHVFTLDARLAPAGTEGVHGRFSMHPDAWPIEFFLSSQGAYAWVRPVRALAKEARRRFGRARTAEAER